MAKQLSPLGRQIDNHFVDFHEMVRKTEDHHSKSSKPVTDGNNHIEHNLDMVPIGSGAERKIEHVKLSRYACYHIVQNAYLLKPRRGDRIIERKTEMKLTPKG